MRTLLLLIAIVALPACTNQCDRMCDAEADLMERCFDSWGSSWAAESYSGRDEFTERCYAVWGDELDALESDEAGYDDFLDRCERQLQVAIGDVDCESLLLIEP